MKLTKDRIAEILETKPVLVDELDIKEVFALLGFRLKEYSKASLSPFQSYEVHYRRTYLFALQVDDSRALSLRNEYINFSDGCNGVTFGGIDTVKEVLQTTIMMAQKLNAGYDGTLSFNEDENEYSESEYQELITTLNKLIFESAE